VQLEVRRTQLALPRKIVRTILNPVLRRVFLHAGVTGIDPVLPQAPADIGGTPDVYDLAGSVAELIHARQLSLGGNEHVSKYPP
jgi:hypothetical protein